MELWYEVVQRIVSHPSLIDTLIQFLNYFSNQMNKIKRDSQNDNQINPPFELFRGIFRDSKGIYFAF